MKNLLRLVSYIFAERKTESSSSRWIVFDPEQAVTLGRRQAKTSWLLFVALVCATLAGSLFPLVELLGQTGATQAEASCSNYGNQLYFRGNLLAAQAEYGRMLRFLERARNDLGTAECLSMLGRVNLDLFQLDRAQEHLERALAIREQKLPADHVDIAESHQNLANLFFAGGNLEKARSSYLKAIEIGSLSLAKNSPDLAVAIRSLGQISQMQGHHSEAEMLYREALRMLESSVGRSDWRTGEARVVLAKHLAFEGDLKIARAEIESGFQVLLATFGPAHLSTLGAQLAQSTVMRRQGDLPGAGELLVQMEAVIQRTLPLDHPFQAEFLDEVGSVMRELGKGAEATGFFRQSLETKTKTYGRNHPNTLITLRNLAVLLYVDGEAEEARRLFEEIGIRAASVFSPESPEMANFLADQSIVLMESGEVEKGLDSLDDALKAQDLVIRSLFTGTSTRELQLLLDRHYLDLAISAHLQNSPGSARSGRLAFETVLRRKGLDLDVALSSHRKLHGRDPGLRQLSADIKKLQDEQIRLWMGFPEGISEVAKLQRLDALSRQIDAKERAARVEVDLPLENLDITIEAVQSKLGSGQALLEIVSYAVIESDYLLDPLRVPQTGYAVGILKAEGEPEWVDLGPSEKIDDSALAFRQALLPQGGSYHQTGRELYDLTLGKLEPHLQGIERLEVSPVGAFELIPLAALIDRQGQYLVDRFSINLLASGRDLLRASQGCSKWRGALLVGGLDYGSGHSSGQDENGFHFSELSASASEIAVIRKMLGTGCLLTGSNATEDRIDGVDGPTILHLATHGFFQSERSLESTLRDSSSAHRKLNRSVDPFVGSGLALSQANAYREATRADDGILTALEIRNLNLSGTEIAVLSACETGLGVSAYNQGIYGMRRALSTAGARSQLLSLWPVSDVMTKNFMVSFYAQLKAGVDRTEALRRVQLAFAEGRPLPVTGVETRGGTLLKGSTVGHPYFWAGFVMSGARGKVPMPDDSVRRAYRPIVSEAPPKRAYKEK